MNLIDVLKDLNERLARVEKLLSLTVIEKQEKQFGEDGDLKCNVAYLTLFPEYKAKEWNDLMDEIRVLGWDFKTGKPLYRKDFESEEEEDDNT